jgi:hypothetical protein
MATQKICMSMNITEALRNYGKKSMKGLLIDDNGKEMTDKEVRQTLQQCLDNGDRVFPMGNCEHFDRKEGCMCFKNRINP